ncbi:MAG: molybdenum cofactor sulfurase [Chloroflexi bacterium RBG_13_60_13]|nr:MAG: molybdenum cofactor sulfurase [Chloroflexi bacterium RBG_13_60_13]
MAEIVAVCRSRDKGTRKEPVASVVLKEGQGVAGDAHADCGTHRQVSLLAEESVRKMAEAGLRVGPGDFAENITTRGISLVSLPKGTRLALGEEAVLEVSQIGKECHTPCAIFHQVGWCIMPREGIFARVVSGGLVRPGDGIRIEEQDDRA